MASRKRERPRRRACRVRGRRSGRARRPARAAASCALDGGDRPRSPPSGLAVRARGRRPRSRRRGSAARAGAPRRPAGGAGAARAPRRARRPAGRPRQSGRARVPSTGALPSSTSSKSARADGQVEGEGAALAGRAVDGDRAAEQMGDLPADGQAEAGAAVLAAGGAVGLLERPEDRLELLLGRCRCRCRVTRKATTASAPRSAGGQLGRAAAGSIAQLDAARAR